MNGIDIANFGFSLLGGTAGGLAIASWLGNRVISQMLERELSDHQAKLDRQLESHKAQLRTAGDIELERLRTVGAIAKVEHEVMFSRLQDRRAEIVGLLYSKLVDAARRTGDYVGTHGADRSPEVIAAHKAAGKANWDLFDYLDLQRIWLPKECCEKVEAFTDELRDLAVTRQVFSLDRLGSESFYERRSDELLRIWDKLQKKVPAAQEALAQEFRILVDPRLSRLTD
ncbi:MAG TPA: hypothetical protein VN325_44095 [Steroidobacteraceae bacterium]|nr:hypothetical protein [Steroidobacteraceae bacterium]